MNKKVLWWGCFASILAIAVLCVGFVVWVIVTWPTATPSTEGPASSTPANHWSVPSELIAVAGVLLAIAAIWGFWRVFIRDGAPWKMPAGLTWILGSLATFIAAAAILSHYLPDWNPWYVWAGPALIIGIAWLIYAIGPETWKSAGGKFLFRLVLWILGVAVLCFGLSKLGEAENRKWLWEKGLSIDYKDCLYSYWYVPVALVIMLIIAHVARKDKKTSGVAGSILGFFLTLSLIAAIGYGIFLAYGWAKNPNTWKSSSGDSTGSSSYRVDPLYVDETDDVIVPHPGRPAEFDLMPGEKSKRIMTSGFDHDCSYPGAPEGKLVDVIYKRGGTKQFLHDYIGTDTGIGRCEWIVCVNKTGQTIHVKVKVW